MINKRLLFISLIVWSIVISSLGQSVEKSSFPNSNFYFLDQQDTGLDSVLHRFNVFMIGECHDARINIPIQLSMIDYLCRNHQLKKILIEDCYARCILINRFVTLGDSIAYDLLKERSTRNSMKFLLGLKATYDSLPSEKRFSIVGVDYEQDADLVYIYFLLQELIPHSITIPVNIAECINALMKPIGFQSWKELKITIDMLVERFSKHPEVFEGFLKERFLEFSKIVHIIQQSKQFQNIPYNIISKDSSLILPRERFIANRILSEINSSEDSTKFLIIGGLGHFWGKDNQRTGILPTYPRLIEDAYYKDTRIVALPIMTIYRVKYVRFYSLKMIGFNAYFHLIQNTPKASPTIRVLLSEPAFKHSGRLKINSGVLFY